MIANAYISANDKVHLQNFVFFIVNHIFFMFLSKMTRIKPISNIVKKLAVFILLWIEEKSKVVKDVIKQVVHYNASLNTSWERIHKLVIFLNLAQSIVGPKVFEVLVNLPVQTIW